LRSLGEQLAEAFEMSAVKINQICHAMESYCGTVLVRLEREERELIPLARRLFSIEDWFTIAAQFLSDDGNAGGRQGQVERLRGGTASGHAAVFVR
jgi:hypothetical protein